LGIEVIEGSEAPGGEEGAWRAGAGGGPGLPYEVLVRGEERGGDAARTVAKLIHVDGAPDSIVMNAKLRRDRPRLPMLGVEQPADTGDHRLVDQRATSNSISWRRCRDGRSLCSPSRTAPVRCRM
jgi:hypothetical protein